MISKSIPRKKQDGTACRIKDLVNYLLKGDEHEKVSAVEYHGFISDETAQIEMNSLASQGGGDPLYHFVISWPEDECPTDDQAIEAAHMMVRSLVDKHNSISINSLSRVVLDPTLMQYICAVHRDTKYSHVHVLLNRRDPESHTLLNLWNEYLTRDKACRQIELKQGWRHTPGYYEIDPHDGYSLKRSSNPKRFEERIQEVSHRIEEHTGEKSFIRWVQEEISPLLETAQSWSEIHEKLSEVGIEFQEVRRGLVLTDGFLYAKASSCGASFSRPQLEKRWGSYQAKEVSGMKEPDPLRVVRKNERAVLRHALWEQYQAYRKKSYEKWRVMKQGDRQLQRQSEKDRRQQLLSEKRIQRVSILSHNWRGQGSSLKALLSVHAARSVQKKLELQQQIDMERKKLRDRYVENPFRSWREFCETRAREGNPEAIKAWRGFRYRDRRKKKSACQILPEDDVLGIFDKPKPVLNLHDFFCFIHEDGQVDYFDRQSQILCFSDHGDSMHVFESQDDRVLEAAVLISLEKWGGVQSRGNDMFRQRVQEMVVRLHSGKRITQSPVTAFDALSKVLSLPNTENHRQKPSPKPSSQVEEKTIAPSPWEPSFNP